jgi:hypothetical protein
MATDRIYKGGSAQIDATDLNLTGGLSVTGAAAITGALALTGALTVTGGIASNGAVTVSNGTAVTLGASTAAYFGTGGAAHAVVMPTAASCNGRIIYITELGSGTATVTGAGAQLIGDSGTQAFTPNKYGIYMSDGTNWRTMIESV